MSTSLRPYEPPKQGRRWKIASVNPARGRFTYFVFNANNQVELIASVFTDRSGTTHAVEYIDPTGKDAALAVLDRAFLSGLNGSSAEYRKWLGESPALNYGMAQETRAIEVGQGGLGTGDIHVKGDVIAAKPIAPAQCGCAASPGCGDLPTPNKRCIDSCCNYIIGNLNKTTPGCNQELAQAEADCALVRAQEN